MKKLILARGADVALSQDEAGDIDEMGARSRAPIRRLALWGAILLACIVVGVVVITTGLRERALGSGKRELENTVLLLVRHFDQRAEDFEAIQRDLDARIRALRIESARAFKDAMSGEDVRLILNANSPSDVTSVNVFDATGMLINSSAALPDASLDTYGQSILQSLESETASSRAAVLLTSGSSVGDWGVAISHRVTTPSGELLGFVTKIVPSTVFERFFASVVLGEESSIALLHSDGTLLARYPHMEAAIGKRAGRRSLFAIANLTDGRASARIVSPFDGKDRLAAMRPLSQLPLAIIATVTVPAALSYWRDQTLLLIAVASIMVVVVAMVLFLIGRQISRQHQAARRKLAIERHRLDTAINNMTHGLLLFDSSQRLVICNQQYINMFGLSLEEAKPGHSLRSLLMRRKELGSFKGDVDAYCVAVRDTREPGQSSIETLDGRSVFLRYQPLSDGGWVVTTEDITERSRYEAHITHLAHYDPLTDLPNRALFREKLEQKFKLIDCNEPFAVFYIDLDDFKRINDSLGHPIGDELLKEVAVRLRQCLTSADSVARLGGDEFAIVRSDVAHESDLGNFAEMILAAVRQPYDCAGHRISVDASIGIALAPRDSAELDELLKNADLAMYAAKAEGRRTWRFFRPELNVRMKARQELEQDLRQIIEGSGLSAGGFEIHYQPLVSLHDDIITGCEALLRWRHPTLGMISPAEFIPVAEDTGLINVLGEWVLRTACAEAVSWPDHVRLAVNVSPIQFGGQALGLTVAAALAAFGLAACRLELEVTEAVLIRDIGSTVAIINELRAFGVSFSLDDFGTGYSSLNYLQHFPFDRIKIDRMFVREITEVSGSSSIVQAVVNIASARNMATVAEGVETQQQLDVLRAVGCTEIQGFLCGAPMPAADIRRLFSLPPAKKVAAS